MGWPGRAQRPKANVEQDGEASKLKELRMHTHQQGSNIDRFNSFPTEVCEME